MVSTITDYDNTVLSTIEDALFRAGLDKALANDIADIVRLAQQCAKRGKQAVSA